MGRRKSARVGFGLAGAGAFALGLLVFGLVGTGLDSDQLRVCRSILPALHPEGRVTVQGAEPGPLPGSVRLTYEVERIDQRPLNRWVLCSFAGEGLAAGRTDLVGVLTADGELPGSNLYLLKRYYLETPDGVAGDPGFSRSAALPEIPLTLAYALQQGLVSLPRTAIYGLLATAYALVFGLVGRINLAFGELAAVGAAATVAGAAVVTIGFGISTPLAGLAAGLFAALFAGAMYGAVGGHFAMAQVVARTTQPSLIATVGLSLALMEYLRLAQSPVTVWLPPVWSEALALARAGDFLVGVTPITLVTAGVGLVAAGGLLALMRLSPFGRAWRAYADDARAAELFGVDGPGLLRRTLAVAGAMAGLSGMLIVAQYGGLGFAGGFQFGLKALIAAIIGGIGSVPGALVGGLTVGLFETLWQAYLPIEGRDIALYAALVVFLIYRPGGLLGERDLMPRPV